MGTIPIVRGEPDEVLDTAAIIDTSERLVAESRALLDDMSQQLEGDAIDLTAEADDSRQSGDSRFEELDEVP